MEKIKTDHSPCKTCKQELPAKATQHCGLHHDDKPLTDVALKTVTISVRKK